MAVQPHSISQLATCGVAAMESESLFAVLVTKQKSVDKSHSVLTNTADFKFECSMFHQTFLSMCYVAGDTLHISGAAGSRSGR